MTRTGIFKKEITNAGGSYTLNIGNRAYGEILLYTTSTVSLNGPFNITFSGIPLDGQIVRCFIKTADTLSFNSYGFSIGTKNIPEKIFSGDYLNVIDFMYNANSNTWEAIIYTNLSGLGFISTTNIKDGAITTAKILNANVTPAKLSVAADKGYIIRSTTGGAMEYYDTGAAGNVLMSNGTDVVSQAISGDIAINGSGVVKIKNGAVTQNMLAFTLQSYLQAKITLNSSEILTLFTNPVTILSAPGADKYYDIVSAVAYNNFNSAAFVAGTDLLELKLTNKVWQWNNPFLEATLDTASQGEKVANAIIGVNQPLIVTTTSANPTAGDGSITLDIIYRIVKI